jgi:DNA-directed RNA polymerase subunit M/transcription elongation factor TFIIS
MIPFEKGKAKMDVTYCMKCKKRLIAKADKIGRTELVCTDCDRVDPMKTNAVNWVKSSLAPPT